MKSFEKLVFLQACVVLLILTACSSENHSSGNISPASPPSKDQQHPTESKNSPNETKEISFKKFGVIREFGGTDNAALFGLLSESGKLQITQVVGPGFLKTYRVGELNKSTVKKIFSRSAKPLSQGERDGLLSEFNGATIIYTEGYNENLCNQSETQYEIVATGKIEDVDVEVTFQFEALPNPNGNCGFHVFGIVTRYMN